MTVKFDLDELTQRLRGRRYPVAVLDISTDPLGWRTELVVQAEAIGLCVADARDTLLSGPKSKLLGALSRGQVITWLKSEAASSNGILGVNADELIGSWPFSEQARFFKDLMQQELRLADVSRTGIPLVLASSRVDALEDEWATSKLDGCGILLRL